MARVDDILATLEPDADDVEHYGVKGMKWGVRNDKGHEGETAKTKTIAKADKKYDRSFQGVGGFIKVNNAIADKINPRIEVLNAKPKYSVDMTKPENKKAWDSYVKEYRGLLEQSLNETMTQFGTNASGTKQLTLKLEGEGENTSWVASLDKIQHSEDDIPTTFRIRPYFNEMGQITGQTVEPVDMKHFESTDAFLEHYGVKGMKWGVRKDDSSSRPVSDDVAQVRAAKSKVRSGKVTGGHDTSSLSNKELQTIVTRMNLEQQHSRLVSNPSVIKRGAKVVTTLLAVGVTVNQIMSFANSPAGKALQTALKSK